MNEFTFTVHDAFHGIRIDSFLVRQLRNYTPFRMQRMVRGGAVAVDGKSVELAHRVRRDERVTVRLVEPPDKLFDPQPLPLEILFEDDWLIAVNKPAGLIAHPVGKRQTGTLCNAIQHHLNRQTRLRGILRPGIVHRLDRMTSGVLVVAKDFLSHKRLSIQFQRNQVRKEYLAVVEGIVETDSGEIDRPLGLIPGGNSILMTTRPDARDPKPARTQFEVLQRFERLQPANVGVQASACPVVGATTESHTEGSLKTELQRTTLVRITPLTGRIHQIRVHLAAIGHPIVGDEFYGPFGEIRASRFDSGEPGASATGALRGLTPSGSPSPRHLLHAAAIAFEHPITRTAMTVTASASEEFPTAAKRQPLIYADGR